MLLFVKERVRTYIHTDTSGRIWPLGKETRNLREKESDFSFFTPSLNTI